MRRAVPFAAALLALSAALAFAPGEARAQNRHLPYVIPPGSEQKVQGLFAPLKLGKQVAEGWFLGNIAIKFDTITVELRKSAADAATLELHAPKASVEGAKAVGLLQVKVVGSVPPSVLAVVEGALAQRSEADLPWKVNPATVTRKKPRKALTTVVTADGGAVVHGAPEPGAEGGDGEGAPRGFSLRMFFVFLAAGLGVWLVAWAIGRWRRGRARPGDGTPPPQ